ncbi:hypothetical protein LIMHP_13340 [Leptospira interrogans serovar Manilae]|nr:hypothetical protein LIMLP_13340 [Leptospira interrogans serovar Manilae]AKP30599.1 hypothetical protein LIMHP_13340 [Leptospira interrogans serovar Manilae]
MRVYEAKLERSRKRMLSGVRVSKAQCNGSINGEAKAQVVKIIILVGTLEKCAFLSLLILKSSLTSGGLIMVESVLLS